MLSGEKKFSLDMQKNMEQVDFLLPSVEKDVIPDLAECLSFLFLDEEGKREILANLGLLSQMDISDEFGISFDLFHESDGLIFIVYPPSCHPLQEKQLCDYLDEMCDLADNKTDKTGGNFILIQSELVDGINLEYLMDLKE